MSVTTFGYRDLVDGIGSNHLAINQNTRISYILAKGVLDRDLTTPPGSPSDADAYIPAATATGVWAGHEDDIAYWFEESGVWKFIVPDEGLIIPLLDEDVQIKFSGSGGWDPVAGSGTVTSVGGTGTVAGMTLTGTVTGSGNLTLGGTLSVDLTSMVTGSLPVTNGGTGRATGTTAYALIATGTTATGAQQTLANGATTEILVGGGAAALPVWTAANGTGAPVRTTNAALVTPALGTPTALVLTNATGLPAASLVASTSQAVGFGSIELGHATDTTVTRVSAGVAAIEGQNIITTATLKPTEWIPIACSDETTALTTGVAKVTFRMPYAFTVTAVRASVTTAPTGGSLLTVDINESGSTILSTKLTFDASEKTTTTAATAAVISDSSLADDAEITIDIDQVGSTIAGAGLKVYLIGNRT